MISTFRDRVTDALAELYSAYGYSRYKMSKFEEYSLYVRNRDSLISDGVITFTDRNGKLMALKPDVTLSIIKNGSDADGIQKVYYNENVYRVSKGTNVFKEIMQTGLECIGALDSVCIAEVLRLADKSLTALGVEYALDVSHLGIIALAADGADKETFKEIVRLIGDKNIHELENLCSENGIDAKKLTALSSIRGDVDSAFEKLYNVFGNHPLIIEFEKMCRAVENINIDFSTVDDINYYNGIVFKGYVKGVPSSVLSGGQYDLLMKRMGRNSGAVGFALYIDLLERMDSTSEEYDADVLLIYKESDDVTSVLKAADKLRSCGESVYISTDNVQGKRFKRVLRNGEENNA